MKSSQLHSHWVESLVLFIAFTGNKHRIIQHDFIPVRSSRNLENNNGDVEIEIVLHGSYSYRYDYDLLIV